jgi:ribokinase
MATGMAMIVVDQADGENRIILSPQANHSFTPEDDVVNNLFATKPKVLVMQLEIPLPVVLATLRRAKAEHVTTIFNPAPAVPLPDDAYDGLDHLMVNETEATLLSGIDVNLSAASIMNAAQWFVDKGVRNVVITLGGRGAYFNGQDASGGRVSQFVRSRVVPKEKIKDTTGAGDTFVGVYATALLKPDSDALMAVEDACWAASLAVEKEGAMDSMPWQDEFAKVLEERKMTKMLETGTPL